MKELGEAINESLSDSEQISEVVSRIKEGGYDIFLVLEATIGVSKQGEKSPDKTSLVTTLSTNPEFKINDQDLKFLKSLRIKIDEEKQDKEKHENEKHENSQGQGKDKSRQRVARSHLIWPRSLRLRSGRLFASPEERLRSG